MVFVLRRNESWFKRCEYQYQDLKGWTYIPINISPINLGREAREMNEMANKIEDTI